MSISFISVFFFCDVILKKKNKSLLRYVCDALEKAKNKNLDLNWRETHIMNQKSECLLHLHPTNNISPI